MNENNALAIEIRTVLADFFPRLKPQSVSVGGNLVSIVADECDKVQVAKFLLKRYPALYWVRYESRGNTFIYSRDSIRTADKRKSV
jgi:hypothetical protein